MSMQIPDFSMEQWRFLALLKAFEAPLTINIVGHFEPLPPGPLFDVINKAKKHGWLIQKDEETFVLSKTVPAEVKDVLAAINTNDHLYSIIETAQALSLESKIAPHLLICLMEKMGFEKEAAEQEIKIAEINLAEGDQIEAWELFKSAADRLIVLLHTDDCNYLYLSTILKFSNLSFLLSKGLASLEQYLHKAHDAAFKIGDKRSHAMINMHIGRLFYFSDRRIEAMAALSVGLNEVEELGDEDIFNQSAGFLGIFYLMQGLFKEALPHLERSANIYMQQKHLQLVNPMAPVLFGYCLAYLGEFHRAIGSLDFNWRMARDRSDHSLAATLRIVLSTILFYIKREEEAEFHLKEGLIEAKNSKNALALYLASAPLAWKHLKSKDGASKAHNVLSRGFEEATAAGLVRQYASPWIMEMIHEFEDLGFEPIFQMSFQEIKKRAVNENNIHLQGVALRLETHQKLINDQPIDALLADLEKSRDYLEQSGDVVQMAKTLIEAARIELSIGNKKDCNKKLNQAWTALGGYADIFFPEDLRNFLDPGRHGRYSPETPQESVERFIEFTESLFPVHEYEETLMKTVIATNRFFGAERGGLFWFPGGKATYKPDLRASSNISALDIQSDSFKPNMAFIVKAFKEEKPVFIRNLFLHSNEISPIKALLCIPVEVRGKFRAVLYHDNSYMEDCFDFLDTATLSKMMQHVSRQIERIYDYFQIREERNSLIVERTLHDKALEEKGLVYECPVMKDLIRQVDIAAQSDSNIMIFGETGVGKELIARRIHAMSPRHNSPLIVVDSTSIPENLFESELFGHEKGAFTGAERQKRGRLELADKGTLFIDEIGELPKSVQVKFLRAIQERHFYRVGGNRLHHSDFRLIAATNRNLAKEVAEGKFREDLYYRLNVVPFRIPPLRERIEDILLIAEHFFNKFSRKYKRNHLSLDAEVQKTLKSYNWPGNVRELENILERSILLSSDDKLEIDLPSSAYPKAEDSFADMPTIQELERRYIQYVLHKTDGKLGGPGNVSEILGLNRTTLYSRMKKLGMR